MRRPRSMRSERDMCERVVFVRAGSAMYRKRREVARFPAPGEAGRYGKTGGAHAIAGWIVLSRNSSARPVPMQRTGLPAPPPQRAEPTVPLPAREEIPLRRGSSFPLDPSLWLFFRPGSGEPDLPRRKTVFPVRAEIPDPQEKPARKRRVPPPIPPYPRFLPSCASTGGSGPRTIRPYQAAGLLWRRMTHLPLITDSSF